MKPIIAVGFLLLNSALETNYEGIISFYLSRTKILSDGDMILVIKFISSSSIAIILVW